MLLKHLFAIIFLSLVIVAFMPFCHTTLQYFLNLHGWVLNSLGQIFAEGNTATLIKQLIALLSIPLAVGLLMIGAYWVTKFDFTPYILVVVWIIWIVLATAIVLQYIPK